MPDHPAAAADPARPAFRLPEVVGLRVLNRLGLDRIARMAVMVILVFQFAWMITVLRTDLIDQTAIGTDSSNYYAAGLRLNEGHPLYALGPGDRPVPLNPPAWSVPLLSPPLIAVAWRPLALLGDASMVLWRLAGAVALGAAALWMAWRGSRRRLLLLVLTSTFIAEAMWSGNVNPFIILLVTGIWFATSRGQPATAGALVAIAAGLKLTPVLLVWWFIVRGEWRAVRGFTVAGVVVAGVSLVGAGVANHVEYFTVVRETAAGGATPWSLAGFLENSGVPASLASLATFAWTLGAGAAVWLLRARPRASFVAAVLMVLYSSPVVMLGNLAMLIAATAPWQRQAEAESRAVLAGLPAYAASPAVA